MIALSRAGRMDGFFASVSDLLPLCQSHAMRAGRSVRAGTASKNMGPAISLSGQEKDFLRGCQ